MMTTDTASADSNAALGLDNTFQIDDKYEFSAPKYFDFNNGESEDEIKIAELWFETALSYAPSRMWLLPFLPFFNPTTPFPRCLSVMNFSWFYEFHFSSTCFGGLCGFLAMGFVPWSFINPCSLISFCSRRRFMSLEFFTLWRIYNRFRPQNSLWKRFLTFWFSWLFCFLSLHFGFLTVFFFFFGFYLQGDLVFFSAKAYYSWIWDCCSFHAENKNRPDGETR